MDGLENNSPQFERFDPKKPKLTYEEFVRLVQDAHAAWVRNTPADYDQDAEMDAEHRAVLGGADL